MNKKIYKKPSVKVVELDNTAIICTSLTGFNLNEAEVDNYDTHEHDVDTHDIWGSQW